MAAPYVPTTPEERQQILAAIGVASVEDLFTDIPAAYRDPELRLPPALSEQEVLAHLASLAERNWVPDGRPCFLGGGFSRHFVPSVVGYLTARGEFQTPYTPYQPEASQGVLQALYEFQTAVCLLTGMEVANAGMYDGATALAEAALMACRLTRRSKVAVRETVSPLYREVLASYLAAQGIGIAAEPDGESACLILQEPNFFGSWEEPDPPARRIHDLGGLLVVAVDPLSLALFRAPAGYGADIVVGEGQPLGLALSFGGPGVGLFACRQEFLRQMPGRIVGRTVDARGRGGFVLTLQTREQHIRRERATSNICTAETLAAIALVIHVAALGKQGLRDVAALCYHKAHEAAARIGQVPGYGIVNEGVFFEEFVVRCPLPPAEVNQRLLERGILGGLDVSDAVPQGLLLCVTETTTRAHIEALVEALASLVPGERPPSPDKSGSEPLFAAPPGGVHSPRGGAGGGEPESRWNRDRKSSSPASNEGRVSLLMDLSRPGRRGPSVSPLDVPEAPLPPASMLRRDLELPEVSELDLVRYFTRLSQANYAVDTTFYPLGSCTMKYNPKVNEEAARLPGFAHIHPFQPPETVQGALELMHELQEMLAEIVGMDATSLAPSAGAHGEMTGMLLFRAYHHGRGETQRTVVLAPDSSHGTNPASATMAGFRLVTLPTDTQGDLDVGALKRALGPEVAGIMLTMPSTLGLFDPKTPEICRLVHEAGGLVYGDGANLNALLGRARLGEMGFDIVHINVHKTFSTPHGGGGPGAGPICVKASLAPFLPAPFVVRADEGILPRGFTPLEPPFSLPREGVQTPSRGSAKGEPEGRAPRRYLLAVPERSVGRIGSAWGNFGILVRAYTYIRMHGAEGLREVSGAAVLNANYLRAMLKEDYHLPYDRLCMHEVVFSASRQKALGVKAGEICKRLLDYGFYAPTVYFPLIVDEALMIEPTETESVETLDAFIAAMVTIAREARDQPDLVRTAPHTTPVLRLDEARAARQPDLRWRPR